MKNKYFLFLVIITICIQLISCKKGIDFKEVNTMGYIDGNLVSGEKQGVWYGYYFSGEIESKGTFVDNKLEGEFIQWYKNGKVKKHTNYINGIENGKAVIYFESGNIKSKGNYVNGMKSGAWYLYNENGELDFVTYYPTQ